VNTAGLLARRGRTLGQGWQDLPVRLRWALGIGALILAYFVAELISGHDGYIYHHAPLGIILVGVVFGSVTSLGAMGLVLIYRAGKFINFAQGALGSLVGVLAIGLVKVHGLNYWVALPAAVVVGAAVGGLTEIVWIRRFRDKPRLLVSVVTIALIQVFGAIEFIAATHEGFTALTGAFAPPFNVSFTIDVYTFHSAEVLSVAVVPVVLAFLGWFLLKTNAGIAVRAAAENNDRALTFGIPVKRLSTIVWVIAGALAVLTFMLAAPYEGVQPTAATNPATVLLPMLAAAVVARMESLPVAFGAGIGLGIMESLVRWNTAGNPAIIWAIYLGVIVLALLAQSGKMSRALEMGASSWSAVGALRPIPSQLRRLPEVRWARWALFAALGAALVFVPWSWGPSNQLLAGFAMVWAMVGVSMVVLTGWLGQISLGQFGIAGVAGIVVGNLVARYNLDFFFVMVIAAVVGAAVALLVGLPALRIRGLFLAVTTLALAVALDQYFLNDATFPQFIPSSAVTRPLLLQRFNLSSDYSMYLVCLGFLGLSVLVARGLRKARAGRAFIGINDNERAAASAAVAVTRLKLAGFAVAGMIAGVAGGLDILLLRALNPGSFPSIDSVTAFVYSVIGGLGSVAGVVVGVLFFKFLESITALGQWHELISGVVAIVVLSFLPGGVGQFLYDLRDAVLRFVANRRGIVVPSLVADKRQTGGPVQEDLLAMLATGNGSGDGAEAARAVPAQVGK
jgi:branched-chain amino acid transport system permease protein